MSGNEKIKFAVIGQGHIGRRHAEMIRRNPEAELVAVCDVMTPEALGIAPVPEPFYQGAEQMLSAHPEIDVVTICTPNGLHATQSILALDHLKHVVCEKPMGLSKSDCEKVIYKALQVSRQVFAVMQNRYSPPSAWIKKMVEEKLLGDIYMVQINCYWNRDERYYKGKENANWKGTSDLDGGTLFTQFSHFIDIMYWVFGDIENIHARFNDFNHQALTDFEDSGSVSFDFVNGGIGTLNYSTAVWDCNLESSMTVIGSKGSIKIGGQYMDKVEYCHVKDYEMPALEATSPANDYGAYKGSANNHHFIFQNVIDTLKGRTSPTTNAMEGLKVVEIIERIYKTKPAYV